MSEWETTLGAQARALRDRLDHGHPNSPPRLRVRKGRLSVALLLLSAGASIVVWPHRRSDPVALVEAHYRDTDRLQALLKPDQWDDATRRQFQTTLAEVEKALDLAREALRHSPDNADFQELCHIAYRAKRHLFEAYRFTRGG